MEGEVATGDPHAWKGAKDGSGAVGCIGRPLGRFAAGFLFVSAGERLANATVCRFCGCFCHKWIVCWAGYERGNLAPRGRAARSFTRAAL